MLRKISLFALFVISGYFAQARAMDEETYPSASRGILTSLTYVDKARNSHVTQLDLSRDRDLHDIEFLRFFPNLRELDLSSSSLGNNYKPIAQLIHLEKLNIFRTELTTARYLTPLVNLKSLKISVPALGKSVKYLAQLPQLEDLWIEGGVQGIERLSQLTHLKKLRLSGVFNDDTDENVGITNFPSLKFLSSMVNLRDINLAYNDYIFSIKPLLKLPCLKYLNLSGSKEIRDLRKLKKLTSLVKLDLSYIDSFYRPTINEDLKALVMLPNLKILIVSEPVELPKFPKRVRIQYKQ